MPNMSLKKNEMPSQEPNVRNKNFLEVALGYTEEQALDEAARCLNCKNHPCVSGCPVQVKIPEFIKKITEKDYEGAYQVIHETSSLPAVCGRVCPQEHQWQLEEQLVSLKKTAEINNANAVRVHQMHDKLVSDIEALETKRDTIKATAATARAQEKINKMQDGGKRAASSIDAFNRMEAKANKALDQAMAHSELNAGVHTSEDLLDKYVGGGSTSSVDDELAAMKAQLGN